MNADLSGTVDGVPERFVPDEMHGDLIEAEHLVRYWWASELAKGRRVLDAACGVGYGTTMLATAGAREAIGMDIAEDVVATANDSVRGGATFVVGDVRSIPFPNESFDLVTCFETIEHVDDAAVVLAEIARVLVPAGILLISSPNPDGYVPGNPHHVREFRAGELQRLLAPHFSHTTIRRQFGWVASSIVGDEAPAMDRLAALPGVEVATVIEPGGGAEPYAIVAASNHPLPALPARLVATGLAEPRRWLELHEEQQRVLSEQWQYWQQAEARRHEAETRLNEVLDQADRRIAVIEEDNRKLKALLERADRILADMKRSPSWRITAPLRILKRLLR